MQGREYGRPQWAERRCQQLPIISSRQLNSISLDPTDQSAMASTQVLRLTRVEARQPLLLNEITHQRIAEAVFPILQVSRETVLEQVVFEHGHRTFVPAVERL